MSEEELKLWNDYKENQNPKARERLIVKYTPFVKLIAGRMAMNLPKNIEEGDLMSYGMLGLIDAVEKFSLDKNVKFETYAQLRINGAILDELRNLDWAPRSLRQKMRVLEKITDDLSQKLGRTPNDEEIAREMNIPLEELYKLYNETKKSLLLSLNEIYEDEESSSSRLDFISDNGRNSPQELLESQELKDMLANALEELSEREKLVVTLYYYEELTLKEIAQILGVTDSRVSQLHTKAILRLRGKLGKMRKSD
ncbi:MAG: FliA/WhiG family RNA polymerase sigma factor [Candidatus Wallbacteria bacterium]|nr:FliA/WhiG family RNA polymerase sigma factor [Candidatus Wallbacteria bacterium]